MSWIDDLRGLFRKSGGGNSPHGAGRKYGRSIPPALPAHRMLSRGLPPGTPLFRDLRPQCTPIKDQLAEGSCCGHTFATIDEWIHKNYLKHDVRLSPQYAYSRALISQGDFPIDAGSDGLTLCRVLIGRGCCEESAFPYVSGGIAKPTVAQDANALHFALGAFHGVTDAITAVSILGDPTPWPVAIGFEVYESFESNEVARTGVMPIPKSYERLRGGHEVAGVGGYDIGDVPTIRPGGCPPALLIQNSWGYGWGLGGFFWMPLQILDSPAADVKIIHSGHPWRP